MKDLEPIQYEDLYDEADAPLTGIGKNFYRGLLRFGLAWVLVLLVVSLVVKFPNEIHLPFEFRNDAVHFDYKFDDVVYVVDKYIEPGQEVQDGTELVLINSPGIAKLISKLEMAKAHLDVFISGERKTLIAEREILEVSIEKQKENIKLHGLELSTLDSFWERDSTNLTEVSREQLELYEINSQLLDKEVISNFDLAGYLVEKNKAVDQYLQSENDYLTRKQFLNSLIRWRKLEIQRFEKGIERYDLLIKAHIDSLGLMAQLQEARIVMEYGPAVISEKGITLKAQGAGLVTHLFDGHNELEAGEILLTIEGVDQELYGYAEIPAHYTGRVPSDATVAFEISSFPHYEWGLAHGQIASMSGSPNEDGRFPIRIEITDEGNFGDLLHAGMTGVSAILIEEKSLMGYLVRKINKESHDIVK